MKMFDIYAVNANCEAVRVYVAVDFDQAISFVSRSNLALNGHYFMIRG